MFYYRFLGGILVVCLTCANGLPAREIPAPPTAAKQIADKVQDAHAGHTDIIMACAKACADCQVACDSCSAHCLNLLTAGKTQHARTMQLCDDCAAICAAAAQVVARHGPLTNTICMACADACSQCAKSCEIMKDDAHMKHCADLCRLCEKACRTMTGQAAGNSR
jgi:hypothetical protein